MKSGMLTASVFLLACAGISGLATANPSIGPASRTMAQPSNSIESIPKALRPVMLDSLTRHANSPSWIAGTIAYGEQKVLPSDDVADKAFGQAVAFSSDGTVAFVGAPNTSSNPGAVYVFSVMGGVWTETQELKPTDSSGMDYFGDSISASGDRVLIGASYAITSAPFIRSGAAYIFTRSGGSWTQTQKLTADDGLNFDEFGWSVALDGENAIIGNDPCLSGGSAPGAAYIFTASGTVWSQTQKLVASDGAAQNCFGQSVAISGSYAMAAAPGRASEAAVYVFEHSNGAWTETQILTASDGADAGGFGSAVALQGTTAVVGAYFGGTGVGVVYPGWAYVYRQSGGIWAESQKLIPSDADLCAISATSGACQFGYSVALDGDAIVIGAKDANGANGFHGAAYVYSETDGIWSEDAILAASDGARSDKFGWSVAISGTTALVGANYAPAADGDPHRFEGAAYFYSPASPSANIDSSSLAFSVPWEGNGTSTFAIGNSGNAQLTWAIDEAAANPAGGRSALTQAVSPAGPAGSACSNPSDVPWLGTTPTSGSVAAGASQDVTVAANATGLAAGTYSAVLCVTTNDPLNSLVQIPVSLTVDADDGIFEDGFDGAP